MVQQTGKILVTRRGNERHSYAQAAYLHCPALSGNFNSDSSIVLRARTGQVSNLRLLAQKFLFAFPIF
jgi:hypothetical protein